MSDDYVDYVDLFEGDDGDWYFAPVAQNGKRVSQSEGYKNRVDARETATNLFPEVEIRER